MLTNPPRHYRFTNSTSILFGHKRNRTAGNKNDWRENAVKLPVSRGPTKWGTWGTRSKVHPKLWLWRGPQANRETPSVAECASLFMVAFAPLPLMKATPNESSEQPAATTKTAPPGDPGKRRPPPGAPPGRAPPAIAPPGVRPAPPTAQQLAIVEAKEEEVMRIGSGPRVS